MEIHVELEMELTPFLYAFYAKFSPNNEKQKKR